MNTTSTPAFSPLYLQIKQLILQSLQAGEWKAGEIMPSELDLAARFKVSQGTVRKAIDELASEHLVVRRQGKGTFVATHNEQHIQYRFLRVLPDEGDLQQQGLAERQIIACKRQRASAEVARALGLKTGDSVIHVGRVLGFAGIPVILEALWLPSASFKGLSMNILEQDLGPMYALFEMQFGIRMVRATERIKAVLAPPLAIEWLKVSPATPLLQVERIAYTYNDVPMELRKGLYLTDHHHYENELS